jgi:hypothetical protein
VVTLGSSTFMLHLNNSIDINILWELLEKIPRDTTRLFVGTSTWLKSKRISLQCVGMHSSLVQARDL